MTRIYVMTHKQFVPPNNSIYIPLQVGRAGKADLGYLGDDTGDTISELNCYYGELTGLYWLWKNSTDTGNVGVCHYRRFFVNDSNQIMTEKEYDTILDSYDIITSNALHAPESYQDYYAQAHRSEEIELERQIIQELYPQDYPVFEQVMRGTKYYFGNLMVTSRELFDEYCAWLFPIFARLQDRIDFGTYDEYQRRLYGFLSEQLLLVWITARGLRVYECTVGIYEEKAETVEFKLAMSQLIRMRQITEARKMFYEILKIRPDLRLPGSDLSKEIPRIEQILYICELEQQMGEPGMLAYTQELKELLIHYDRIHQILADGIRQEDIAYLKETGVTRVAVEVIVRNQGELASHLDELLAHYREVQQEQSI